MPLTGRQKRHLWGLAQQLKPVVQVGDKGLTQAVLAELDGALAKHELIKVKINVGDRDERQAMLARMGEETGAELVRTIGRVGVLFRRNEEEPRVSME